ncbi:NAD(P)-binding domain-containing protein [Streptomyces tauricus]|uniref:NAD(P)-binding domain-containing protein n=1 Tax=Streptomyces tauricus TaxID=68274 RepID=UPI001BC97981
MEIGTSGVGHIGKTLTQRLSAAGHAVKVANSRGPHTIEADALPSGGRAVTAAEAAHYRARAAGSGPPTPVRSRACGSPNSGAGRSPRLGTRSVPTRSRLKAGPREPGPHRHPHCRRPRPGPPGGHGAGRGHRVQRL